MDQRKKYTFEEIVKMAEDLIGKTFKDLGIVKNNNKGLAGQVIESYYGLKINNKKEPDFKPYGVDLELKVTPIKSIRKGTNISAKERLSLSMINFNKDYPDKFEDSDLYKKIKNTLIIYYEDSIGKENIFSSSLLLKISSDEMSVIKKDYDRIIRKIKKGDIDNISEGDTTFLGAARKGSGRSEKKVTQKNTGASGYRRAWTFKTGYMTRIARRHFGKEVGEVVSNTEKYINRLRKIFTEYLGMTPNEILLKLDRKEQESKSRHVNAIKSIMTFKKIQAEVLDEYSLVMKTMKESKQGNLQEDLSFKNIDIENIDGIEFHQTDIYKAITSGIVLFRFGHDWKFKDIQWIKFSKDRLKIAQETFETIKKMIRDQNPYLPKSSDDVVIHLRPKAKNSKQKIKLKNGTRMTKQALWINKKEVK